MGYAPNERPSKNLIRNALIPHSDDSEITLNVCLSEGYTGGELNFHGNVSKDEFHRGWHLELNTHTSIVWDVVCCI